MWGTIAGFYGMVGKCLTLVSLDFLPLKRRGTKDLIDLR